jgi:hypothetical protein
MKLTGPASTESFGRKKRPRYAFPAFIRLALKTSAILDAYRARPAYQQNDYVGWIVRAKRAETRVKRLKQMLSELRRGDRYMNMAFRPWKKKQRIERIEVQHSVTVELLRMIFRSLSSGPGSNRAPHRSYLSMEA